MINLYTYIHTYDHRSYSTDCYFSVLKPALTIYADFFKLKIAKKIYGHLG